MKELFKEYMLMIFYFLMAIVILGTFMSFISNLDNSADLGNIIENYEVSTAYKSYHLTEKGEN